jgi:hypothetical protein
MSNQSETLCISIASEDPEALDLALILAILVAKDLSEAAFFEFGFSIQNDRERNGKQEAGGILRNPCHSAC